MQAAVVLNSLPNQQAALVLSRLEPSDINTVLDAITRLDDVSASQISTALDRLATEAARWRNGDDEVDIQIEEIRRSVDEALATPQTSLERSVESDKPFGFLVEVIPMIRLHLLEDEHPKNIAIVLSMLPPDIASQTMKGLDRALRVSVLKRICEIEELDAEEVVQLSFALKLRLNKLLNSRQRKTIGVKLAANMLSCSDEDTQEALIAYMGQTDPDLAVKLQCSVFKIERLETLSADELRAVLKNVDTSVWAPALKNAPASLKSKIYSSMAARPAEILAYEIDQIGHVDGVIEDLARQNVIQVVLRLSRDGRIDLKKSERAKLPLPTLPPLSYDAPFPATSPIN
jgi:flagellar motor switch protein FliG